MMNVLLVNGSPHKEGCTYTALCEVAEALKTNGIETDIFWIGVKPISGCIACKTCVQNGNCALGGSVNDFLEIAGDYDGFVFGTPVHWGGASGGMTSFMDRAFYADLCGGGNSGERYDLCAEPPPVEYPRMVRCFPGNQAFL